MRDTFSDAQKRACPPGLREQMTCHSKRKLEVTNEEDRSWIGFWLVSLFAIAVSWICVLIRG